MSADADRAKDGAWFRRVLGHYPTGVSVVTGIAADGAPIGLAVGSFSSVSLDPPLVAFMPSVGSSSWPKIRDRQRFCVNILASDQEPVCRAFAARGPDKFAGLSWRPASSGSPILDGAVAWVDCDLEAVHEAGDHLIVIGWVRDLEIERPTLPLLFFQGGYGRFHPHSLAVRDTRFGVQLQLIDRLRPLMEELAERTEAQVVAAYCDGSELVLLASAGTPTDPRVASAAIGQRVPVVPPIGIWWMAFASEAQVNQWLSGLESPELRARYLEALARIRASGYSLGLGVVQTQVGMIFDRRPGPHVEPTAEEREMIGSLALDPLDYVPPQDDALSLEERRPDAVSLWAPAFTADGELALGLMMTGYPDHGRSPHSYAEELLRLTRAATGLVAP